MTMMMILPIPFTSFVSFQSNLFSVPFPPLPYPIFASFFHLLQVLLLFYSFVFDGGSVTLFSELVLFVFSVSSRSSCELFRFHFQNRNEAKEI